MPLCDPVDPRGMGAVTRAWPTALFSIALTLSIASGLAEAAVVSRVAATGANTPGCGAEATPCATIQYAVNQVPGQGTILVAGSAAGTRYFFDPTSDICSPPLGYTGVVCVVNKEIVLRGGYSTADWTTSDPVANLTIIDGESVHRGILVADTGPATALELEGFTVTNGFATGSPSRPGLEAIFGAGAGLLADVVDHLEIRNVVFRRNVVTGSNVGTSFGGAGGGGGVGLRGVPDAQLTNVVFEQNEARGGTGTDRGGYAHGGGLYSFQSTIVGDRLVFRDNLALAGSTNGSGQDGSGARADALGGGLNLQHGSDATLTNVSATGNRAIGGNAPLFAGGAFGGGIETEEATLDLTDADIRGNEAIGGNAQSGFLGFGGGISMIHSHLTATRIAVVDNLAKGGDGTTGSRGSGSGGGIQVTWLFAGQTASFQMTDSVIAGNEAREGAGPNASGGGAGGLLVQGMTATLRHVTIAGNRVDPTMQGQGVNLLEASASGPPQGATLVLEHSLIADHPGNSPGQAAALHVRPLSSATLTQGMFANNSRDTNASDPSGTVGSYSGLASMLSAPSAGFVAPGAPFFDYHLLQASAARNQATSSTQASDLDASSRAPQLPRDIGADEWEPGASIAGTVTDSSGAPAGDLLVDVSDAGTHAPVAQARTANDGGYMVASLPPGSYRVRFSDALATKRYFPEWHLDASSESQATPLSLASGASMNDVDAVLDLAGTCRGLAATIVGTRRNDELIGTAGNDVIIAGRGNDEIYGAEGNDTICAGPGSDQLFGGPGQDYLLGGSGPDVLRGEGGPDTLRDGAGRDTLIGGPEDDDLKDLKGRNSLTGGQGNDTCRGREGDTISSCEVLP